MSYQSALFCQFFTEELKRPGASLRDRIRAAMKRLSPKMKSRELRIYIYALHSTMVVNDALRPDWQARVFREH